MTKTTAARKRRTLESRFSAGVFAAAIALLAADCYHPDLLDCTVTCGPGDSCPSGQHCDHGFCSAATSCHADASATDASMDATSDPPESPDARNEEADVVESGSSADASTDAAFVCDAATGKCAGECAPNTDVCEGNSTKHCGADGYYESPVACAFTCIVSLGVCGCEKESDTAFCSRLGATCGAVTAKDNCGNSRMVSSCGSCNAMQSCTTANHCACLPSFTGPSCSLLRFEGFGPTMEDGQARGVSNDGMIVASHSYNQNDEYTSYIWTHATGPQTLLAADPARQINVRCSGISGNGAAVVGFFDTVPIRGFLWTASSKAVELSPLPNGDDTDANAVSYDGSVVVGMSNKMALQSMFYPVRWVNGIVSELPGFFSTSTVGVAWDVSDDGKVIVGNSDMGGHRVPFRWVVGDARLTATALPPGRTDGSASFISGDGSAIVGYSGTGGPFEVWRWSAGNVVLVINPTLGSSQPTGINQDGTVMIGASANGPWIWDGAGGMRSLATFFMSAGIDYTGWTLNSVSAISADGKVLAGAGLSPTGKYRAWIARLP